MPLLIIGLALLLVGCQPKAEGTSKRRLHAVYTAGKQLQAALSVPIQLEIFSRYRTQFQAEVLIAKDEFANLPIMPALLMYEMAAEAYSLAGQAWDLRERYKHYCSGLPYDECRAEYEERGRTLRALIKKQKFLALSCGNECDLLDTSTTSALLGGAVTTNKYADDALLANGAPF